MPMERWMKDRATGSIGGRGMSRLFLDQEKKRLQRLKNVRSAVRKEMKVCYIYCLTFLMDFLVPE